MDLRRLAINTVFAVLVSLPASAGDVDDYLSALPDSNNRDRWRTVLLAECLGAINDEVKFLLLVARKEEGLPPFDKVWCIRNHHAPKAMLEGGKES